MSSQILSLPARRPRDNLPFVLLLSPSSAWPPQRRASQTPIFSAQSLLALASSAGPAKVLQTRWCSWIQSLFRFKSFTFALGLGLRNLKHVSGHLGESSPKSRPVQVAGLTEYVMKGLKGKAAMLNRCETCGHVNRSRRKKLKLKMGEEKNSCHRRAVLAFQPPCLGRDAGCTHLHMVCDTSCTSTAGNRCGRC